MNGMNEMIRTVATYTGIGGIALIALLILFREMIRKTIFPQLTKQQGYQLLRLIVVMVTVVVLASIVAWAVTQNGTPQPPPEEPRELPVAELRRPAIDGREMELSLNTELNSDPSPQRTQALITLHSKLRGMNRQFTSPGEVWAIRSDPLKRPPPEFSLQCAAFEDRDVRMETAAYLRKSASLDLLQSNVAGGVATIEVADAQAGDEVLVFLGVVPNDGQSLATNRQNVRLVAHP